jgi:hypothetical protein
MVEQLTPSEKRRLKKAKQKERRRGADKVDTYDTEPTSHSKLNLFCSCSGMTSIQALPDLGKISVVLGSFPSNRQLDIVSSHPRSCQGDSPGSAPGSNAADGVLLACR